MYIAIYVLSFASSLNFAHPRGTYYASISPVALPFTQEIKIKTLHANKARIYLKGIVDMTDDFEYDYKDGEWKSEFSPEFESMLRKWRCRILRFDYNHDKNTAVVTIKLPVMSLQRIILQESP